MRWIEWPWGDKPLARSNIEGMADLLDSFRSLEEIDLSLDDHGDRSPEFAEVQLCLAGECANRSLVGFGELEGDQVAVIHTMHHGGAMDAGDRDEAYNLYVLEGEDLAVLSTWVEVRRARADYS